MARTKRKVNPLLPPQEQEKELQVKYRTAGYVRLSVEDGGKPGSDTLAGQEQLIKNYIRSHEDMEFIGIWCDNGSTGTNFSRPQFESLMEKVKGGEINCIVVKDLSRFGRNYKEAGNYLERIFPFLNVRFVAVNDNFDSLTAERNDLGYILPLKNIINEAYSKDISRKTSSALGTKQKHGEFIGAWAPYGYSKDPEDQHHLIVNEETAPIVQQIFKWRADGTSIVQIMRRLNDADILSPSAYLYQTGKVSTEKYHKALWNQSVIKNFDAKPHLQRLHIIVYVNRLKLTILWRLYWNPFEPMLV